MKKKIERLKQAQTELQKSFDRIRKTMGGIIQAMSLAIKERDANTAGHQRQVLKLFRAIAMEMGLSIEFSWPIAMRILQHHEGMDDSGYPLRLKRDEDLLALTSQKVAHILLVAGKLV